MTEEELEARLGTKQIAAFAKYLYEIAGAVWSGTSWSSASEGVRMKWNQFAWELINAGVWYEGENK